MRYRISENQGDWSQAIYALRPARRALEFLLPTSSRSGDVESPENPPVKNRH
jgi:hypothetical protein